MAAMAPLEPHEEGRASTEAPCQGPPTLASSSNASSCQGIAVSRSLKSLDPSQSLNPDPYNLCAESLALAECTLGVDVRRTFSETELVRTFGGHMMPGTPDGMFEDWDGVLTCVQVVRVPLVAGMSVHALQETISQTVLTKVIKSQRWLAFTEAAPGDFVIFCWLPFSVPNSVVEHVEALMHRIRGLDPRFSLRLRTPEEPSTMFPALFARHKGRHDGGGHCSLSEADVSTYLGTRDEDDEDEEWLDWDITWEWDADEPTCQDTGAAGVAC